MKIQLASDLHLDLLGESRRDWTIIEPAKDADILVLAGDVDSGSLALERFRDWPVPILYVAGNHEFYRHNWPSTRAELQRQSAGTKSHVLDNQRLDIGGVRFLGCTLWTDFSLDSRWKTHAMRRAQHGMNDFRLITTPTGTFMPEDSVTDHQTSRRWLEEALSEPFAGTTVVVTHHGPHPKSIHPRFASYPLNAAFVSDLSPLLGKADLWLHGHVHNSFDYWHNGCRIVANPAGYALNARSVSRVNDLQFENPDFVPSLAIDVTKADRSTGR